MNRDQNHDQHDDAVARAWAAFAEADAQTAAPPALETRARDAWRAARDAGTLTRPRGVAPRVRGWRHHAPLGLAAAAVTALVAGAAVMYWRPGAAPVSHDARTPVAAVMPPPAALPALPPPVAAAPRTIANAPEYDRAGTVTAAPDAVLTLAADPLIAAESLQLIRLRVPRQALQSLGVVLIDPDAEGSVEIDVLVGGDGLPREIRRVEAAQE